MPSRPHRRFFIHRSSCKKKEVQYKKWFMENNKGDEWWKEGNPNPKLGGKQKKEVDTDVTAAVYLIGAKTKLFHHQSLTNKFNMTDRLSMTVTPTNDSPWIHISLPISYSWPMLMTMKGNNNDDDRRSPPKGDNLSFCCCWKIDNEKRKIINIHSTQEQQQEIIGMRLLKKIQRERSRENNNYIQNVKKRKTHTKR